MQRHVDEGLASGAGTLTREGIFAEAKRRAVAG
jgi:antitoxin ParD1/3/4